MNNKSLAIAAVLAAALLAGIFSATTPMTVYAEDDYDDDDHDDDERDHDDDYSGDGDKSETNTELKSKQSNTGSGGSTNFNCGDSSIAEDTDAGLADIEACGTLSAEVLTDILGAVR